MNYNLARYEASYATIDQVPQSTRPEVSFVGRSNVGKSSLMNRIFNRKGLVRVSSKPGCTQAVNFFSVGDVDFVDLPGYGFAKVPASEKERWHKLIDGYFEQDRRFALCVALIDIRHDVSKLDVQMLRYLMAHDIPFIVAFTKADKLSKAKAGRQVASLCQQISFAEDAVVLPCSAHKGTGIDDLRMIIDDAVGQALQAG